MKNFIAIATLLAFVVGCSGGPDYPPTEKVSGKVTLDGNPVAGANITFIPVDSNGKPAAAQSGEDGSYSLMTFQAGDGAIVGKYNIQVSKFNTPDGGHSPYGDAAEPPAAPDPGKKLTEEEELARMSEGYSQDQAEPQGREEARKNELPAKYSKAATSGLEYDVVEGDNTYDIVLEK